MASAETIVAAATPPGRGGVSIVRIAGPLVPAIGAALLDAAAAGSRPGHALPASRHAAIRTFIDAAGEPIDTGLALFFPAPHSYTGDDVLELHGHGGPVIVEALIERAVQLGARRAGPGEFTQRAYLNGKLDLAQAEAVVDLIDAGSIAAARAALRSLQGEFSARVHSLTESIAELRAWVEAAIDFAEEEVDWLSDRALHTRLAALNEQFDALEAASRQGRLLTEGMTMVIAGRPNVGKSTLLNRLAGHDAAIVTPIAGTTRDVLHERIHIDGMPLHIIDTAGLRTTTADPIEAEGIRRAQVEMGRADRILFVIDAAEDPQGAAFEEARARLPPDVPVTLVFNKMDLVQAMPASGDTPARLWICARTGAGMETLTTHLKQSMGFQDSASGLLSARARHVDALKRARSHTEAALRQLHDHRAGELVAEELRLAQRVLGEVTGEVTTEDLLGRIFATFCIGK